MSPQRPGARRTPTPASPGHRACWASLLLQQGESVVYVKEQLGHSSIQITVDTNGHLIPRANRGAVHRLDDDDATPPSAT